MKTKCRKGENLYSFQRPICPDRLSLIFMVSLWHHDLSWNTQKWIKHLESTAVKDNSLSLYLSGLEICIYSMYLMTWDQTSLILFVHWKDWCWSWSSNTLATPCEEMTHWKGSRCWERMRAGGEGGARGWDGWMASLTQRTWVWASSER